MGSIDRSHGMVISRSRPASMAKWSRMGQRRDDTKTAIDSLIKHMRRTGFGPAVQPYTLEFLLQTIADKL